MTIFNSQRLRGGNAIGRVPYSRSVAASANAVEAARKREIVNSNVNLTPPAEKCSEPAKEK